MRLSWVISKDTRDEKTRMNHRGLKVIPFQLAFLGNSDTTQILRGAHGRPQEHVQNVWWC